MDATELRAKLAALAEFDVTEYEEPGVMRVTRAPKPAVVAEAVETPESREPEPVVIHPAAADWGARSGQLDALEAELDRMGA